MIPVLSVEIVILRKRGNDIDVLLTRRPKDDPDWPNLWHLPGTIVRNSDDSLEDAARRAARDELDIEIHSIKMVCEVFLEKERGKALQKVLLCLTEEEPTIGRYFNINKLPEDRIKWQVSLIEKPLSQFKKSN